MHISIYLYIYIYTSLRDQAPERPLVVQPVHLHQPSSRAARARKSAYAVSANAVLVGWL